MPMAEFGEKVNFSSNQFFKLKAKGDRLRFRLLGNCFIEGKHFFELEEGWDIQPCPRINDKAQCDHCDKFFKIMSGIKKVTDENVKKAIRKEAEPWKAAISVYYPVIDRTEMDFKIFQTTMSVRNKIETEVSLGTKVLAVDFIVVRTQEPGAAYYSLSRVDSSDTPPLNAVEQKTVEDFKGMDLAKMVGGSADEESGVAQEANEEVVDDTVNF